MSASQFDPKIVDKMRKNKKIMRSMGKLVDLSKKYKMTFSFGGQNVVLDNRKDKI